MSGSSKTTRDAETIHFFRIILGHYQKLELPKRFVRKYGNDLSNSVLISAPSGPLWEIELIKSDGEIWLGNGWKDLADYFSLEHGNLLVFSYEGHSRFCVSMIFDQTTLEIEYPINISSSSNDANHDVELQTPKVEEIQSDVSVEIVENISECQKTVKKTPVRRFSPIKRTRTGVSSGIQGTCNVKKSRGANGESKFQISRKSGGKISTPPAKGDGRANSSAQRSRPSNEAPFLMQSLTSKRNDAATSKATNFESENPFFLVVMRPSYLTATRCYLHVPSAFAKTYFTQKQNDLILQDSDGKTWSVHYKLYGKRTGYHFLNGWKEFALHHKLKAGDTCAFELLEGLEISLRVTIFRVAEDANDHITAVHRSEKGHCKRKRGLNTPSQSECDCTSEDELITSWPTTKESRVLRRKLKTEHRKVKQVIQNESPAWYASRRISFKETAKIFQRLRKFKSNHPVFIVVMTASFLWKTVPTIPSSFCKEYIKHVPRDVTLKFKGKIWSVMLTTSSERPAQFGSGWWAFALENKLLAGDVCVFEMIKRTNIVFEVSIFRGSRSLG
ncbi:hypothetical protein DITRI_Ditri20bG0083100 [Diplodiscus trichospermus]